MRTTEAVFTLAHTQQSLNIDISCIQETDNGRIDTQTIGEYVIFMDVVTPTHQTTQNTTNRYKNLQHQAKPVLQVT